MKKENLIAIAKDFNKVMGITDPPIDVKATAEELLEMVIQAAGFIRKTDIFSVKTTTLLKQLILEQLDEIENVKINLSDEGEEPEMVLLTDHFVSLKLLERLELADGNDPAEETTEDEETTGIEDAEVPEKPKKEKVKKEKVEVPKKEKIPTNKEDKMTRPKAVGLALQNNPKTLADWAKEADKIYTAGGGLSNVNKIKADIGYMYPTFIVLGVKVPSK